MAGPGSLNEMPRRLRMAAARLTQDQRDRRGDFEEKIVGVFDALDDALGGDLSYSHFMNVYGGQRGVGEIGFGYIVEAGDSDILRDLIAVALQPAHSADGQAIGGADNRIGFVIQSHEDLDAALA